MKKIFGLLVTLMVIGLTLISCTPATSDTKNGTGSSTGIDTTVLKKFMKETFDDFTQSKNGKVYSGKIKGTENDYVLIPAKAAAPTPNDFYKVDDNEYSFGDAKLIKDSAKEEGINIYSYYPGDGYNFFFNDSDNTIHMSSNMCQRYFDYDCNIDEPITIGGIEFHITY